MKPRPGHWDDSLHFFAAAALAMRRFLVDYARAHRAAKRPGRFQKVELDDVLVFSLDRPDSFLALDQALARLAKFAPRQNRIFELRFFAGLSVKETAQLLRIGVTTVKSEWQFARAWLRGDLEGDR